MNQIQDLYQKKYLLTQKLYNIFIKHIHKNITTAPIWQKLVLHLFEAIFQKLQPNFFLNLLRVAASDAKIFFLNLF